jgi:hypothetical protein
VTLNAAAGHALAAGFGAAAAGIIGALTPVVSRGALNVKNDAIRLISGHAHSPHYPRSISYEVTSDAHSVGAEIGPDKSRGGTQAALGNILEFGTSKNAPIPHLHPALLAEEPRFVAAVETVAVEALRR